MRIVIKKINKKMCVSEAGTTQVSAWREYYIFKKKKNTFKNRERRKMILSQSARTCISAVALHGKYYQIIFFRVHRGSSTLEANVALRYTLTR